MKRNTFSATPDKDLRLTLLALCIATACGLSAPAALAQAAPNASDNTAISTAIRRYNIQAQPLSEALLEFGQQSGLQVTASSNLIRGKQASPVNGNLSTAQALRQLLEGTGLRYEFNGGMVNLVAGNGTTLLPPVKVQGDTLEESAYGPVDGYVAKRSATGTKTDTPLIETPQSISIVSREEMDIRGIVDIGEAVSYNAGVVTGGTGESRLFGGNSIRIRGFGGNGTAGASFNEYLDGLKLLSSDYITSNLDPWLFERVEILKGPASVLFGQTQPGGIVNMVSKKPHDNMTNKIRTNTGNHDKASLAFDLGSQLSDTWQFRITGLGLDGETQQDHSDRERQLLAPSFRWSNDKTELTLLAHYQRDEINASILSILPKDAVFSNPNGRVPLSFRVGDPDFEFWDRETLSVSYLFSHHINEALTFRQNVRYTSNEQDSNWMFRWFLDADQRTLNRVTFISSEESDTLALDNQLEWTVNTGSIEHTLLVGLDYYDFSDSTVADSADFSVTPTIDIFNPVYNQTIPALNGRPFAWDEDDDLRQTGIYIQDQIKVGDLSLLVGGRYDDAETSTDDHLDLSTTDESNHEFTGRVGMIYNFANGLAPYASYAESFEPVSGRAFDGSRFEPMKGKQYEVGVKYQPVDTDHLFTLAVFDLTQENMTTADPDNTGFSIQTGEVQTRGIEFEGKLSVSNNLNLTASYTYLDDEITKSNNGDQGNQRPQIPEQTASLWANYLITRGALSGIDIGMGVRYLGETQGDFRNTFSVPSYTLVDLALRYDLGQSPLGLEGWQASFNAQNLFDKYYIASCFATHSCHLGQERSIRASLEYRW